MADEEKFLTQVELIKVVDRIEFSEDIAYLHGEVVGAICSVCDGDHDAVPIEEMDEVDDNHPYGNYWMLVHFIEVKGENRACAGSGKYPKEVFEDSDESQQEDYDYLDFDEYTSDPWDFEGGF